jgi:hypothetical protein
MWRQLDQYLVVRIFIPWLPVYVGWQVGNRAALQPEVLGALAVVLAGHTFARSSLKGTLWTAFVAVPLITGVVVCTGYSQYPWRFAILAYVAAGLGTAFAAITDLRGRR